MGRPKKNHRLGGNSAALLQLILAALAVLFIALSLKSFAPKYDLTQQKTFTLSDYTKNLLRSEMLDNRTISITCLADQNSSFYDRVKTILKEYERNSNNKIIVQTIDPINNPNQAFKFTERLKLRPTEDIVVIEDSKSSSPAIIAFSDLMVFEVSAKNERKLSAYQIEDNVTTNLLNLIESDRRVVYLVSNNSDNLSLTENSIGATLQSLYRNLNIDLQSLSLSEVSSVPEDASGLLLLTPQYDLEAEDMQKLVNYWQSHKSSLYIILDPTKRPKRLRAFLRLHGITLRNDRIFTLSNNEVSTKTVATFTQGTELNDSLAGKSTLFDGISSSLEVRELAEDLINQRIAPIGLVKVSQQHYSESRFEETPATYLEGEDFNHNVYLGAAVIKGNEMSDETAGNSSRMVVLSTSNFLKPETIRDEQIDFIKNSINWLVGRPELIGIGPKPLQRYKLNLVSAEIAQINRLTLIFLPLAFLLIGAFMWNLRRP